jgi:3-oxoacyl-[acyl-carrier-protein] synthase-1
MNAMPVAILKTGLVSAVGLSAPASCAALRAKLSNPSETRFIDAGGDWIMAHQVTLNKPWRGLSKLAKMASLAIDEVLEEVPKKEWQRIPLLLCVAEPSRPGRVDGLDDRLFLQIQAELDAQFSAQSGVVPQGRCGIPVALARARTLLGGGAESLRVLIVATDSFVSGPTLSHYGREDRLLTPANSNGFMPGEGAGALLVGQSQGVGGELVCMGVGFGRESAHLGSGEPLRADGLSKAIRSALAESGCEMHHMDFRIADLSGEHYYFKEAALALGRIMRQRKAEFDIWHPAECTGEQGATVGASMIALADAACRNGYAPGPNILAHMSNDGGERAALSLHYRGIE